MIYEVELSPDAQAEISALPGYVRAQALQLLRQLSRTPRPPRAKELRGKPGFYRIWLAAKWRIVYEVDDAEQFILVLRVRLKESIDYESI